jgi:hypothetical protein
MLGSVWSTAQTYQTLKTNADITNAVPTANPVGAVAGGHSVSLSGGATYSIPIQVAPGTHGVQPNLSLAYNSQGGSGVMGMGWNITGLSAITRVNKDLLHDDGAAPMTLPATLNTTNSDRLALDGNRMVKKTTSTPNYGYDACNYTTELEQFSTIVQSGDINSATCYFTVYTKDGTTLEFGKGNAGYHTDNNLAAPVGQILVWRINKITDTYGNYMTFDYKTTTKEMLVDKINYTGNVAGNITPYNAVQFNYASRSDINTVYMAGYGIDTKLLLTSIEVKDENSAVFKTYKMEYAYARSDRICWRCRSCND